MEGEEECSFPLGGHEAMEAAGPRQSCSQGTQLLGCQVRNRHGLEKKEGRLSCTSPLSTGCRYLSSVLRLS